MQIQDKKRLLGGTVIIHQHRGRGVYTSTCQKLDFVNPDPTTLHVEFNEEVEEVSLALTRTAELRDWLPEGAEVPKKVEKLLHTNVLKEYSLQQDEQWKPWPGTHKHVYSWCLLKNHCAVGWNESPSRGWSFPVLKLTTQQVMDLF